jgi:hypothetical protein
VKQGYPLSPTLFGLCINELEQMITKFVKDEGIEYKIKLLFYANDIVLFANNLEDAQKLMKILKRFCIHNKVSVNSSKTKIMLVKSQNKEKPENICSDA